MCNTALPTADWYGAIDLVRTSFCRASYSAIGAMRNAALLAQERARTGRTEATGPESADE